MGSLPPNTSLTTDQVHQLIAYLSSQLHHHAANTPETQTAMNPSVSQVYGDLVVRDGNSENYVWQSFDDPYNSLLQGMKLGWDFLTGQSWKLTSWGSPKDPSSGNFIYELNPRKLPQALLRKGPIVIYRHGPWDGVQLGGDPPLKDNSVIKPNFVFNESYVYCTFENIDHSIVTRLWPNPVGSPELLRWNHRRSEWITIYELQRDECDTFKRCGPNGLCDNNRTPVCHCPTGFMPRFPED